MIPPVLFYVIKERNPGVLPEASFILAVNGHLQRFMIQPMSLSFAAGNDV